jgi:GNAT superfamily N-acetyltransferase
MERIEDEAEICAVINDGAAAYRGVIPADRWHQPYMPPEALRAEIAAGVAFWCLRRGGELVAVMGLQPVADVTLIRHAYTRTAAQGQGLGSALLKHLMRQSDRPVLVGTWKAATWAVRFYQGHGFRLASDQEKDVLLRRYWSIPERQIEESVVLSAPPGSNPS